jgi:hypothetical protein
MGCTEVHEARKAAVGILASYRSNTRLSTMTVPAAGRHMVSTRMYDVPVT